MLAKSPILKLITLLLSIVLLSNCVKVNEAPMQTIAIKEESRPLQIPYTLPASSYLSMSKDMADEEKQNLLIMAGGRFIFDGQWRDGLRILAQTSNLNQEQADLKNILLAKTDLIREQPRAAITRLANVHKTSTLSPYYQVQFHETLALAYEASGNAAESVVERIKLAPLIPDEKGQANNHRILWLTLTKLPIEELNTLALEAPENSSLQGWLKLALIARQKASHPDATLAKLEDWQSQFNDHPANKLLPSSVSTVKSFLHEKPKHLALLLPLTGLLAGPGSAIRDGFMAAATHSQAEVKLYDTAKTPVNELYQQALNEGADYIVGPLSKTDVATVAAMEHPVPTLLLNEVDTQSTANAYHFGLSPADEARQVAIKADQKGYKRALVIAPDSPWGTDLVEAFKKQWQSLGGVIVDKLLYGANENLHVPIRDLLQISESQTREKHIKKLLGRSIQTIPRRREDFDMIFMLAYPTKARQIMPLLKYYFAGNVPVYSTSIVYGGSPNIMKDKDLDGVTFSDMPWVFAHEMGAKNWPEQLNSYNRLYALGLESFALSNQLNQVLLFPALGIDEGVLYLNRAQQIARIPAWAQFKGGVALVTS